MTTKDWLKRGWKLNDEIKTLLEEKEEAFLMACKATSTSDGERVQTTRQNSSEKRFINYADYDSLINCRIDELFEIKKEILKAINAIDSSVYRTLLINRYIKFKTWEQIAVILDYDYYHVIKHLHPEALEKIILPLNTTSIRDTI